MFSRKNYFLLITVILASLIFIPKTFCQNQPISSGSLIQDQITSPSLKGNLLGDPSTRNFIVYLPPSYNTLLNKRYPVVYLMHGSGGNERSWAYNEYPEFVTKFFVPPTDFPKDGFAAMIDRLIADKKIKEMIIIMPDVSNKYGGSYCINSELNGNYEDYIIKDLIPYVDAHYRTLANNASRGIDGISMGGYISIYLAMRHPDVFGAVSSHSGPLLIEASVRSLQPLVAAENPDGFAGPSPDKPVTSFIYMGSSAMAPNLNNPPFFVDLPYDAKFQIREDVLKRIGKYDPVQMIPSYIDALKSLRGIFLDAGDKDELGLHLAVKGFSDALNTFGIENEIDIFDGAHLNKLYTRLAIALEFLSSKLVGQEDFKAIIKGIGEAIDAHDVDEILSYLADDVVYEFVPSPQPMIGKEAVGKFFEDLFKAFPDYKTIYEHAIFSGNIAVTEHVVRATLQGEWMGMPPTGKGGDLPHIDIWEFEGNKIKRARTYLDTLSQMIVIGLMPAPELPEFKPSFVLPDPEPTGFSPLKAVSENNKLWNAKDMVNYAKRFRADAKILIASLGVPMNRDAFIASQEMYIQAFSPQLEEVNTYDMGDGWVAQEQIYRGVHIGPYMGIPPTGRQAIIRGLILAHIDKDGLMTTLHIYWDNITLLTQLGAFPPPPTPEDKEAFREFSKRIFEEVWNKKNLSAVDELCLPSYIEHRPSAIGSSVGTTAFKQFVSTYIIGFPDIRFDLQDVIVEGNKAVIRWTGYGTHLGPFAGVPPTGKVGPGTTGISIMRIENNKFMETWVECDVLGLMGWLGLIPGRELQQWGEPSKVTGNPGDPETNKTIVRRFTEEFINQKKLDKFGEFVHPKVISHDPVISPTEDYETFRLALGAYLLAFPDLHAEINTLIAEGDKLVARWTATGTHKGEYFGIPPTGKPVKFTGITIYRFADGKIVELWWSYDALGILQQIGIIPTGTPKDYTNVFFMLLSQGLNMISLPLEPIKPYTARSLAQELGATVVIKYDTDLKKFYGFVPSAPNDGFAIKGGEGYIVNVLESKTVMFTGAAWTNTPPVKTAPSVLTDSSWAFVFSGAVLNGDEMRLGDDRYRVIVKNLQTGKIFEDETMSNGYFAIVDADLNRKPVIKAGDKVEITVVDSNGKVVSGPFVRSITLDDIRKALANFQLRLGDIIPERTALLQNYPNPFNPETWIPFQLKEAGEVSIRIYDSGGRLIRTFDLGHKPAGVYISKSKAVYWDGKDETGERVASGVYFYTITSGKFSDVRKMVISK